MDSDFSAEQQLGDDNSSLTYCFLNAMDACYHQQSMPSPQGFHAKNALGGNVAVGSAMAGSYSSFQCHDPTVAAKPLRHTAFSDSFLGGSEFGCGVVKGAGRGMYEGSTGTNGNISSVQPHAPDLKNLPKGWANLESGVRVSDNGVGVIPGALAQFSSDTAFAERAAKFSSFGNGICADSPRNKAVDHERNPKEDAICEVPNLGPVLENDTGKLPDFSEQANCANDSLGRKRKAEKGSKSLSAAQDAKESEEIKAKRRKAVQHSDSENDNGNSSDSTPKKGKEKDSKFPSKEDYIHVRARRGQATDSHSLAERVRREKINERMKFLQDLVPSCNKVTGKAVMLDEIINYVQSLQHQVEFLSMKLAAVNPKLDFNINNVFPKEMCGNFASQGVSPSYLPPDQFKQTSLQTLPSPGSDVPSAMSSADSAEVFADTNFQIQSPWDSELQNLIHMGFVQGRLQHYQAL